MLLFLELLFFLPPFLTYSFLPLNPPSPGLPAVSPSSSALSPNSPVCFAYLPPWWLPLAPRLLRIEQLDDLECQETGPGVSASPSILKTPGDTEGKEAAALLPAYWADHNWFSHLPSGFSWQCCLAERKYGGQ